MPEPTLSLMSLLIKPLPRSALSHDLSDSITCIELLGDTFGALELAFADSPEQVDPTQVGECLIAMAYEDEHSLKVMARLLAQPANAAARDHIRRYIIQCKDGPYSYEDDWDAVWGTIMQALNE